MIRPQRHKRQPPRFNFYRAYKPIAISGEDGYFQKDVLMTCLERFGYHTYYPEKWTVTHLASGLALVKLSTEVEAIVLVKRFETKMKSKWSPNISDIIDQYEFKDEAEKIHAFHKEKYAVVHRTTKTDTGSMEDDIPF
jgi:hypothetical protein